MQENKYILSSQRPKYYHSNKYPWNEDHTTNLIIERRYLTVKQLTRLLLVKLRIFA